MHTSPHALAAILDAYPNGLLEVRHFAIALRAEDARHELPATDALGRGLFTRRSPHIYTQDDILRLITAAASVSPAGTIRSLTYAISFGLLAATGMAPAIITALQANPGGLRRLGGGEGGLPLP
ncbi:hypothetical protein NKJ84_32520 [Mesorhizobium sp. M0048]|uniref:hypothetical protein n=1 Tax=Mesorhizobium sp. M0048 TaxID=2956860 RepID=UPI00333D0FCA